MSRRQFSNLTERPKVMVVAGGIVETLTIVILKLLYSSLLEESIESLMIIRSVPVSFRLLQSTFWAFDSYLSLIRRSTS